MALPLRRDLGHLAHEQYRRQPECQHCTLHDDGVAEPEHELGAPVPATTRVPRRTGMCALLTSNTNLPQEPEVEREDVDIVLWYTGNLDSSCFALDLGRN